MDFRITQDIDRPVADVESALFDADFVAATSELPRLNDCELLAVERDGGRVRARVHRRFDAPLNAAVRRAIDPSKLTWVEEVDYDTDRHRGEHRIVPDNYADRMECAFVTELVDTGGGTQRTTSGTMDVKIPLVGGKVAQAVVSGLEEYAAAEADLLGEWTPRA